MSIRVGVVGIGGIGKAHLEALKSIDGLEVVAVCGTHDMEERAKALSIPKGYTDYKLMINQESLDFIHICTTNDTHFKMAEYALIHGVNVILEKPMTLNKEEANYLRKLALEKELINAVFFHNRFYGGAYHARKHIGTIGNIMSIHGHYLQDWMLDESRTNWRMLKEKSGQTRVVADIGSHLLDIIEYISGHKIVEVSALFNTVYDKRNDITVDTEDLASILFKTDREAIGTVMISQSVAGIKNDLEVTFAGKLGSITWNSNHANEFLQRTVDNSWINKADTIDTLHNNNTYPAKTFIDAFREVIRQIYYHYQHKNFTPDYATFNDGYHSMALVDAIYQSHMTKGWVKVND